MARDTSSPTSSIPEDKLVSLDEISDFDLWEWSDRRRKEPKPMSDDVLDAGIQYLKINRELMGLEEE